MGLSSSLAIPRYWSPTMAFCLCHYSSWRVRGGAKNICIRHAASFSSNFWPIKLLVKIKVEIYCISLWSYTTLFISLLPPYPDIPLSHISSLHRHTRTYPAFKVSIPLRIDAPFDRGISPWAHSRYWRCSNFIVWARISWSKSTNWCYSIGLPPAHLL